MAKDVSLVITCRVQGVSKKEGRLLKCTYVFKSLHFKCLFCICGPAPMNVKCFVHVKCSVHGFLSLISHKQSSDFG